MFEVSASTYSTSAMCKDVGPRAFPILVHRRPKLDDSGKGSSTENVYRDLALPNGKAARVLMHCQYCLDRCRFRTIYFGRTLNQVKGKTPNKDVDHG